MGILTLVLTSWTSPDLKDGSKEGRQFSINWAELSKKIPDAQRGAFAALKARSDASLRSINSLPEALPAIDWAVYQGRVAPAIVDDFQKKYEGLSVPYPADTLAGSIASQAVEQKAAYEKFVKDSGLRTATFKEELAKWTAMMPVSEMCKEEVMQAVPELTPEHQPGNPQFWPFDEVFTEEKKAALIEEANRTYFDEH